MTKNFLFACFAIDALQKYNKTAGMTPLGGSMRSINAPMSAGGGNNAHHRLSTLEKMWDWQKASASNTSNNGVGAGNVQFTPQQLLQCKQV